MRRKSDYDKRKHKRVAVGKPVGHLSAVPYHIDRTDIHTYNKQAYKRTCRNFLLEFKCSRAEKSCRKHKRKRTAEQRRQTLHPYRIVGIGEQLSCYIYKIKIINKRIIRLGEAEFAVLKRIIYRQYHKCAHHSGNYSAYSEKRTFCNKFFCDVNSCVARIGFKRKITADKIQHREDRRHKAYVEV